MSFDVNRLRAMASNVEQRSKSVVLAYAIMTSICFFIFIVTANISNHLDQAVFTLVGAVFGSMFGMLAKHTLEERRTVLAAFLELYDMVNKPTTTAAVLPETVQTKVSEEVEKVEIPADPILPNIPSVAAPEEVKAALKAGKTKGKPTRLPPKRKAKTVPPAQA